MQPCTSAGRRTVSAPGNQAGLDLKQLKCFTRVSAKMKISWRDGRCDMFYLTEGVLSLPGRLIRRLEGRDGATSHWCQLTNDFRKSLTKSALSTHYL
jgi:hypothetical protein